MDSGRQRVRLEARSTSRRDECHRHNTDDKVRHGACTGADLAASLTQAGGTMLGVREEARHSCCSGAWPGCQHREPTPHACSFLAVHCYSLKSCQHVLSESSGPLMPRAVLPQPPHHRIADCTPPCEVSSGGFFYRVRPADGGRRASWSLRTGQP